MKRLFTISAFVVTPIIGFSAFGLAYQAQGERVPVLAQYQDKVIYDVPGQSNAQPLQNDCQKRGGTFFAATCAECQARCQFQTDERLIVAGWDVYDDKDVGVVFNYPHDMQVRKPKPTQALLFLAGPTQTAGAPLSDGIDIRIRRESYPPILSFDEYVQNVIDNEQSGGKQVLSQSSVSVGRLSGESYRTSEGHGKVHLIFPAANSQAIVLDYEIADPSKQRFDRVVDRLISSLSLNDTLSFL